MSEGFRVEGGEDEGVSIDKISDDFRKMHAELNEEEFIERFIRK